jgi:hypothetical protein
MALKDVIKKGSNAPVSTDLIVGGIGVDTLNKRLYFKAADSTIIPHDLNTPAGNIAATTVQGAINELDTEKASKGANSDITSLASPEIASATATTQAAANNTTKVATTAYVDRAAADKISTLTIGAVNSAYVTLASLTTEVTNRTNADNARALIGGSNGQQFNVADATLANHAVASGQIGQGKAICKAWVKFNGVTTVTIQASFNIASVTRISAGVYVVTFTTSMADTNYVCVGTAGTQGINGSISIMPASNNITIVPPTASAITFTVSVGAVGPLDSPNIFLSFFGN